MTWDEAAISMAQHINDDVGLKGDMDKEKDKEDESKWIIEGIDKWVVDQREPWTWEQDRTCQSNDVRD